MVRDLSIQQYHYRKDFQLLWNFFASYGLPDQILTDNRPQFTSSEFQRFTKTKGIKHIRSAPYHAATNGEAERCADIQEIIKVIQITYSLR